MALKYKILSQNHEKQINKLVSENTGVYHSIITNYFSQKSGLISIFANFRLIDFDKELSYSASYNTAAVLTEKLKITQIEEKRVVNDVVYKIKYPDILSEAITECSSEFSYLSDLEQLFNINTNMADNSKVKYTHMELPIVTELYNLTEYEVD